MKTKILTLLFLAIAQCVFAQEEPVSYEWLEKQSEIISDLQIKVTGLKEQGFDVTFSKDNFKVFYHDKLASWSCNLGTFLVLIEDIDFSKVTGITAVDNQVVVIFPENLTIQVYGEQNSTTKHNTLDFYTNSVEDRKKLFTTLYELISFMKVDRGLMTASQREQYWQDYQRLSLVDFYIKHPNTFLAWEGNYDALYEVGEKYYKEKNYTEAIKWYKRASLKGSGEADYSLGFLYERGLGVEKNRNQAFAYYLQGAEKDNNNALIRAGLFYSFGWETVEDILKARKFFQRAIDNGSTLALVEMGDTYSTLENPNELIQCYEKFLIKGGKLSTRQKDKMGCALYEIGRYKEALFYLDAANREGNCSHYSRFRIVNIYRSGLGGVPKDKNKVKYWKSMDCN